MLVSYCDNGFENVITTRGFLPEEDPLSILIVATKFGKRELAVKKK